MFARKNYLQKTLAFEKHFMAAECRLKSRTKHKASEEFFKKLSTEKVCYDANLYQMLKRIMLNCEF